MGSKSDILATSSRSGAENGKYSRYVRQISIPGFGREAQDRLFAAQVLILGVGGLGSVSSNYLVRAGVGHIIIVDFDIVDISDLNRQILYTQKSVGSKKTDVAVERLKEINPDIKITAFSDRITIENLTEIIQEADVVLDGLDNFQARMDANKVCCEHKKIFIHGGVFSTKGVVSTIVPGEGPCLRCIYTRNTSDQYPIPVLGPVPGIVASIQCMEAINYLCGAGVSLKGRLLMFEGRTMNFSYRQVARLNGCEHCSTI